MIVIKSLLQSADDASHSTKLVNRLCQQLPAIRNSNARACIYWLVGQHAAVAESEKDSETHGYPGVALWAPDALRLGVKGFAKEVGCPRCPRDGSDSDVAHWQDPVVKLQILTLAARLYVLCPHARAISLLTSHLFQLARYDKDWDVRDRGRFLKGLLRGIQPSAQMNDAGGEDDEDREAGGVILRREQVQVVLYGGRDANMKENLPSGECSPARLGSKFTSIANQIRYPLRITISLPYPPSLASASATISLSQNGQKIRRTRACARLRYVLSRLLA